MIRFNTRKLGFLSIGLVALVGFAASMSLYEGRDPEKSTDEVPQIFEISDSDLVSSVEQQRTFYVRVAGVLRPFRKTMLMAEMEGRINTVNVRVGDKVTEGTVLAALDLKDLHRRLAIEHANLLVAQSNFFVAERAHKRNEDLVARGFVSASASDNTKSALDVARETFRAREAQYSLARQALSNGSISTPLAGIVEERAINPGQFVAMNAPLFSIVDLSELELVAEVSASSIAGIQVGNQVDVSIEGMTERKKGRVDRIAPSASIGSRMIPILALGAMRVLEVA